MIVAVNLPESSRLILSEIANTYNAQKPFLKRAGINYRTFQRLIVVGHAKHTVIAKVEAAISTMSARTPTPELIITIVCTSYGITREALMNPGRKPLLNEAKQIVCWMLYREGLLSKGAIARLLDYEGHAHNAVTQQLATIEGRMEMEADIQSLAQQIRSKIKAAA